MFSLKIGGLLMPMVEISNGELIDKWTILILKTLFLTDKGALINIERELCELSVQRLEMLQKFNGLQRLEDDLYTINKKLWYVEDALRIEERNGTFGDDFVDLARSVYKYNDERARIKKEINTLTNSTIVEEKSYEKY